MVKFYNEITELQGFCAMIVFLDEFYFRMHSDDIGSLLSGMQFLQDEMTADPAAWEDWVKALDKVRDQEKIESTNITVEEAFTGMLKFLDEYRERISSEDVALLLNNIKAEADDFSIVDTASWKLWMIGLDEVLNEKDLVDRFLLKIGPRD